ncbi:helix-turn-helix domain-containing protein [Paenibacillus sp. J5C_2022]|uniref:helix-turn-helix domain-containing protein n=1 Tax=Paenibacillus sp. J5C2022 TaxID=2977129 RepID=UPI0021CFFE76|nr:helix-turn-helix domain-containing protein [Paenibacillus sp. J5C2022]MCU6712039.1 helix-turn-helix domain-containing protein [Paenibacillus sp. J5C2022]
MLAALIASPFVSKLSRKYRNNSLFYKMIAGTATTVVVLSIICFGGIALLKDSMAKNEMNNNRVYLDYSYSYLDNLMKNLQDIFYSIENDPDLAALMRARSGDIHQLYAETNNVYKKLSIIQPTIDEISTLYVYLNKQETLLLPSGTYDTQTFFDRFYKGDLAQWEGMVTNGQHHGDIEVWDTPLRSDSPNPSVRMSTLNIVKSIYADGEQKGVIVANLRHDLVNRLYAGKEFASTRNIYITDMKLNVLLSNDLAGDARLAIEEGNLRGSYDDGKGSIVTYQQSAANGIIFFVSVPKEVIFRHVQNIETISLGLVFLLLIVGLAMSVYLSQRFYYPISEVLHDIEMMSHYSRDSMAKQNELGYIRNHFVQIYDSNNQLQQTMKEGVPVLLDIIFMKVLLGDREVGQAMALCEKFNITFSKGYYMSAVIKLAPSTDDNRQQPLGFAAFTELVQETLPEFPAKVFKFNEYEYTLANYCEDKMEHQAMLGKLQGLANRLEEHYGAHRAVIGIGATVHTLFELEHSRQSALAVLQSRGVMEEQAVFGPTAVGEHRATSLEPAVTPLDLEQRLTGYIMQGNAEAAEQYAADIIASNYKSNLSYSAFLQLCCGLQDIVQRLLNQHAREAGQGPDSNSFEPFESVDSLLYGKAVSATVMANIARASQYFLARKKASSSIDKICDYVDTHFVQDINLNIVADKFGYNANYLSKIMRQHLGMNFSEYMIKKRIEHSKQLLAESTLPIKEVAEQSGYSSSSVFIRAFSKIVGMPPGEYRREYTGLA